MNTTTRFPLRDFQTMLHEQSSKARSRPRVTKGAFGGCTKGERYERVVKRRMGQ